MSSSRKRYGREFKLEVIRRVQETGQSQAALISRLPRESKRLRKERDFLKKNGKLLRSPKRARYRVIATHEGQ